MKKTTLILLIFILSCNQNNEGNDFLKKISKYDYTIIKHFPQEPLGMYRWAVMQDNKKDVISILLLNDYKPINIYDVLIVEKHKKIFNKIKDSLIAISKIKYSPKDTCLFVVNMYTNEKNYFDSYKTNDKSYLNKECLKTKLPIPNFWALDLESNNIANLPNDFDIYVFDAKKEIISRKYLSKNAYMPEYWKHGYSKGVAINEKTQEIIYWFVLW